MRLVECLDCSTENTLDSRFCRSCGGRLPEDEVLELKAENAKFIGDARKLFSEFRTDECKMMVESVLAVDPKDWDAQALMGDCLEREGRFHDAIEVYEGVVASRPDSAIDRVRLHHLHKMVSATDLAVAPRDNRKTAVLAGVAAILMLGSVGSALILAANQGSDAQYDPNTIVASSDPDAEGFRTIPLVPTYAPPTNAPDAQVNPGATEGTSTADANVTQLPTREQGYVRQIDPRTNTGMTSRPSGIEDPGLAPLDVKPPEGATVVPHNPGNPGTPTDPNQKNSDPDPTGAVNPGNSGNEKAADPNQGKSNGIIEIEVKNGGGSATSDSGNEAARSADALVRKARDLYAQGDYRGAVRTYEDALRAGASSGATNQRIGQCYEKLGNRSSAISAYRKAVASYEASMKSGGGSRTQAALDASRQAIKNLGG